MKRNVVLACAAACAVFASSAFAGIVGFVDNPETNSKDWAAAIVAMGGFVNSDMDFETHPLGPLDPNHYSGLGVTLTVSQPWPVLFGPGPGQANNFSTPLSKGEGPHAPSNFLQADAAGTLTIMFDRPVMGIGLFTIDLFNPFDNGDVRNDVSIEAFDEEGASLGVFSAADFNFQANNGNNLYFMGVASDQHNIHSLVFTHPRGGGDVIGIDNIVFAEIPGPGSLCVLGLAGLVGRKRRR